MRCGDRHTGFVLLQSQLPSWVNFPDFERASLVNKVIGESTARHQP